MQDLKIAFALLGCLAVLALGGPALTASSTDPEPSTPVAEEAEESLEISFPDPVLLAGCTAEQTCPDGSTVSCTGWDVCKVFSSSVECDGVPTTCGGTTCSVSTICCDGRRVFCSGDETCEKEEGQYVMCDGGPPEGSGGFCVFCQEEPNF